MENQQQVSIHARLRGAGRRRRRLWRRLLKEFQSTPGSEEPGDSRRVTFAPLGWGFNPRPAPRSRATSRGPQGRWRSGRFNPRPAPRSRATRRRREHRIADGVSIHARLRGAGRRSSFFVPPDLSLFQSTPGSEEPGDPVEPKAKGEGAVSIHARLRGAGRPILALNWARAETVSIHARLRGAGRLGEPEALTEPTAVSIHARLRGAGRRVEPCDTLLDRRFNPRPAPRSRATRARRGAIGPNRFQSTPGSEEPGDPPFRRKIAL